MNETEEGYVQVVVDDVPLSACTGPTEMELMGKLGQSRSSTRFQLQAVLGADML